jgi:broad specificity phosphatase PhoE
MLAASKNAEVWSSPLARCLETASIAFPNRTARLHAELSEMDFGLWEGLTFDEARKRHPHSARRWLAGDVRFRFPSGERLSQFRSRLERVCKKIKRSRAQALIVVAHGGVIRGLLSLYLKTPFVTLFSFHIGYGAALRLTLHSTGAALESLSQNLHIKRGVS